jgi:FkbH-like protein
MNFLEATKLVRSFEGGPDLPFTLGMSGTPDALGVFLEAAAAERGWRADVRMLPFNTLRQWILSGEAEEERREAYLVFPWDYAPILDWRSGVPAERPDPEALVEEARSVARALEGRDAVVFLVPAPTPPVLGSASRDRELVAAVCGAALEGGATLLSPDHFSLSSYLASGTPFSGRRMGELARAVVGALVEERAEPKKVLVTDLDNTLWSGVIGEDGVEGIACGPEGAGFPHFIYQSFLLRLESEGILLAAVSRNDDDVARGPFAHGKTDVREEHLVAFLASYEAKSAQVASLAEALNLPHRAFVFVDDNPVELAEVSARLPEVAAVRFPEQPGEMPAFLRRLNALLRRERVTEEDRERTKLYRRRLEGMAPSTLSGADLTDFLRELEMELVIHDRSEGDRTRAVQLINKTNQFNLNGRRIPDEQVGEILARGGKLFTAALQDRTGSHGEILSFLVDEDGVVQSFVLSCRVFQRRVEHAFLAWLAAGSHRPRALRHAATERNEPFRRFVDHDAFPPAEEDGLLAFDADRFVADFEGSLELFRLTTPEREPSV